MDDYLKYLEDPKFIKWVIRPTKELNEFWTDYMENHESEKDQIKSARTLVLSLQSAPVPNSDKIARQIYRSVQKEIGIHKPKSKSRNLLLTLSKYAAVGLIFFSLGIAVNHYLKESNQNDFQYFKPTENSYPYTILTLSDGKNVQIPDKESEIGYSTNGQIVINKKDTVETGQAITPKRLNELFVPYGKNASIKLPDGTIAHLNAGSRLLYPSEFKGTNRVVSLIGEGYFNVTHNESMPFIVQTQEVNIEVLGTRFDVSAYPGDNVIETVLLEGKVKMVNPGLPLLHKEFFLEPNQRAAFDIETKKTTISEVDAKNYISWHEGYLLFETQDLNRIFRKLERYYNIKIHYSDPTLGLLRISGKLELQEDKESVLNILAKTASVELTRINKSEYVIK